MRSIRNLVKVDPQRVALSFFLSSLRVSILLKDVHSQKNFTIKCQLVHSFAIQLLFFFLLHFCSSSLPFLPSTGFFLFRCQHHFRFYRQESSSRLWLIKVHFGPFLRIVRLHDDANAIVGCAQRNVMKVCCFLCCSLLSVCNGFWCCCCCACFARNMGKLMRLKSIRKSYI